MRDTDDGIDERGWERSMLRAARPRQPRKPRQPKPPAVQQAPGTR